MVQHDLRRIRQRSAARRLRSCWATGPAASPCGSSFPKCRRDWTTVWFALIITLYVGAILFNGLSEYYFWSEFGVRYNFIAVDYLVYTNEVVGNIMESYPVMPMTRRADRRADRRRHVVALPPRHPRRRGVQNRQVETRRLADLSGRRGVALWLMLPFNTRFQTSDNVYVNELQANGLYNSTTPSSRTHSTTSNSTSRVPKSRPKPSCMGFTTARATTCTPCAPKGRRSAATSC